MTKKKENKEQIEEKIEISDTKTNKRTDYILAIFLIFLGSVFLLNTTGVIDWNIWSVLWRFWPLLIIFAGLSLIFEGSKVLSIILAIFVMISLSFIFLWSSNLINTPSFFERVVHQELDVKGNYTVSGDEFSNVEQKRIDVDMPIGSLNITNENLANHLSLDAEYYSNWGEPTLKTKAKSQNLDISLELGKGRKNFFLGSSRLPNYSLVLGSDEIPTELALELGVGQSNLFLRNYNLESLIVSLGAGDFSGKLSDISLNEFEVDVGAGNFKMELDSNIEISEPINLKVGVGKLTLKLPENAQYRLKGEVGIGSIKTPSGEVSGIGTDKADFKSDGYDDAEEKFDILAEVGIGELIIK